MMIVTKLTGCASAGALAYSAAVNDGFVGGVIAIAVIAPFILFAECRPARRWIMDKLGSKRTSHDRS